MKLDYLVCFNGSLMQLPQVQVQGKHKRRASAIAEQVQVSYHLPPMEPATMKFAQLQVRYQPPVAWALSSCHHEAGARRGWCRSQWDWILINDFRVYTSFLYWYLGRYWRFCHYYCIHNMKTWYLASRYIALQKLGIRVYIWLFNIIQLKCPSHSLIIYYPVYYILDGSNNKTGIWDEIFFTKFCPNYVSMHAFQQRSSVWWDLVGRWNSC